MQEREISCSNHLCPEGESVTVSLFQCKVFLKVNQFCIEAALAHGKICCASAENSLTFLTRNGFSMYRICAVNLISLILVYFACCCMNKKGTAL